MIKSLLFLTVFLVVGGAWGLTVPHPACPPHGHYLLPHEYDCTKFYYCEWGNKHIEARPCGVGTEFSEELQVCTWPFIANCNLPGHPPSETTTTTTQAPITDPPTTTTEPTTTPAPITDPPTTQPEPTTTQEPITEPPTTPEPTTTQEPITEPPTTPEPTTTQEPITEPPTTPEPTTTQEPITEPPTTQEPITEPPTTQEPITEPPTTQAPVTEPEEECPVDPDLSEEDRKCTEYCNILPWAHEDCDKYWFCQGNKAILVVCSPGLHFNPSTSSCDFACNAGCERKNVQVTADHEGLNLYLPWNKVDEHTRQLIKLVSK